jgi:hypothetical protein
MLKIVEVHPSRTANGEYVVLQNQGLQTVGLIGHTLVSGALLEDNSTRAAQEMYVFRQDISVKPYARIVLFTGDGADGWQPTNDGKSCYVVFCGRNEPLWSRVRDVYLLAPGCHRRIAAECFLTADVAAG